MAQKIEAVPMRGFAEVSPDQANPWLMAQRQFDIAADVLGLVQKGRQAAQEAADTSTRSLSIVAVAIDQWLRKIAA